MSKKIIHVSNFSVVRVSLALENMMQYKISNGLIRQGHKVINFSDRDMARISGFGIKAFGYAKANKSLISLCEKIKPDGIIFGLADVIYPKTLMSIKKILPHVKILQWNHDWLLNPKNIDKINSKLDFVDVTLLTTAGETLKQFKRTDNIIGFIPNPVDSSCENFNNHLKHSTDYDFIYAGSDKSDIRVHCNKEVHVERLMKNIANIQGLKTDFLGIFDKPKKGGYEYQEFIKSGAMSINLSRINNRENYLYSSDRISQLIGNGILTFVDRNSGYNDIFKEDEFAFYDNEDELFDKIKYYKKNNSERMRIATLSHDRYFKLFNEQIIAKYIIELMFGGFKRENYPWPTTV